MSKKNPHSTHSFATYLLAVMAVTITVAGAVSVDAMSTDEGTSVVGTERVRPGRRLFEVPRARVLSESTNTDSETVDTSTKGAVKRLLKNVRQETRQNTRERMMERRAEKKGESSSSVSTQTEKQPLGQVLRIQVESGSCSADLPARVAKLCELLLKEKQAREEAKAAMDAYESEAAAE